ncbi:MAG: hypothetical protein FWH14_02985 [Oscillospiraceae bacterium]|nr:hypothetical protein [Oscillospiraceae bacterium]
MSKARFIILLSSAVLTLISLVYIVFSLNVNARGEERSGRLSDLSQPISSSSESDVQDMREYMYMLKDYEGRIAIYEAGNTLPADILPVATETLPLIDQIELEEGIIVYSYEELIGRIEDYGG